MFSNSIFNKTLILKINRCRFIFFTSLLIVTLYNIPFFINKYTMSKNANIILKEYFKILSLDLLLVFFLSSLLLFIFSFNKYVLKTLVVLILILSSFFSYIIFKYQVFVDEMFIFNLIVSSGDVKLKDYITVTPIIFISILGILPSLYIIFFVKIKTYFRPISLNIFLKSIIKKLACYIILPLILCVFGIIILHKNFRFTYNNLKNIFMNSVYTNNYLPLNYISSLYKFINVAKRDHFFSTNKVNIYDKYKFEFNSPLKDKELTIVLVIGESSRVQSQSYNGYFRDTNKYTKQIPDLVYLKNVKSCNTHTYGSVPCMLSYRTRATFNFEPETGLISVFKHLGFKTYWISSQNTYNDRCNPILSYAMEASEFTFFNLGRSGWDSPKVLDEEVYNSLVKKAIYSDFKQKLIVFQLEGSHIDYRYRFPEKFMIYTPSAKLNHKRNMYVDRNDYDNTVIYSDYVLSLLLKELKEQNALVLYMSDHGESLEVDNSGYIYHCTPFAQAPKEQTQVAAFIWMSKGMQKLLPNALPNIKKYSELPISHDYIFSTLLGSIGVESKVINKKLDLTSSIGIADAKLGKYR